MKNNNPRRRQISIQLQGMMQVELENLALNMLQEVLARAQEAGEPEPTEEQRAALLDHCRKIIKQQYEAQREKMREALRPKMQEYKKSWQATRNTGIRKRLLAVGGILLVVLAIVLAVLLSGCAKSACGNQFPGANGVCCPDGQIYSGRLKRCITPE